MPPTAPIVTVTVAVAVTANSLQVIIIIGIGGARAPGTARSDAATARGGRRLTGSEITNGALRNVSTTPTQTRHDCGEDKNAYGVLLHNGAEVVNALTDYLKQLLIVDTAPVVARRKSASRNKRGAARSVGKGPGQTGAHAQILRQLQLVLERATRLFKLQIGKQETRIRDGDTTNPGGILLGFGLTPLDVLLGILAVRNSFVVPPGTAKSRMRREQMIDAHISRLASGTGSAALAATRNAIDPAPRGTPAETWLAGILDSLGKRVFVLAVPLNIVQTRDPAPPRSFSGYRGVRCGRRREGGEDGDRHHRHLRHRGHRRRCYRARDRLGTWKRSRHGDGAELGKVGVGGREGTNHHEELQTDADTTTPRSTAGGML